MYRTFVLGENVGYHTFGFKLFTGGLLGGMTETGKMFVQQLRQMLSGCGMKLSFKQDILVTDCKISYTCNIPGGYTPKEKIGKPKMNLTQAQAQDALKACFSKFEGVICNVNEKGNFVSCVTKLNLMHQRDVILGTSISVTDSLMIVILDIGIVQAAYIDVAKMDVNRYNETKSDGDFFAVLMDYNSETCLQLINKKVLTDGDDLARELDILISGAIELCQNTPEFVITSLAVTNPYPNCERRL